MDSSRRYGRVAPTRSEILEYYLDTVDSPATPDAANTEQINDDSSSIYSTDTSKTQKADTQTASEGCNVTLRQAFRSLCQVGLHTANLLHSQKNAAQLLCQAETKVDKMARELLLQRLHSDDNIDSSGQITGEITAILASTGGSSEQELQRGDLEPTSPSISCLQKAAEHAEQLRAGLQKITARLGIEERILLQPTFEQWRLAVAGYRLHPRVGDMPGGQAVAGSDIGCVPEWFDDDSTSSAHNLDRIQQEIDRLLPQLGCQRLQHLLGYIRELQRRAAVSGEMPLQTFI